MLARRHLSVAWHSIDQMVDMNKYISILLMVRAL